MTIAGVLVEGGGGGVFGFAGCSIIPAIPAVKFSIDSEIDP
jgi:hypothetical protein